MNTAEILRAAAARIRQGWCRHTLSDYAGGVCALGALRIPFGLEPDEWGADWRMRFSEEEAEHIKAQFDISVQAICRAIGATYQGYTRETASLIADWNNAPKQTAENVAVGLEYAALIWEQEQQHTAAPSAAESLVTCNRS